MALSLKLVIKNKMTIFRNEKFCCSVAQSWLTLCNCMDCRTHISLSCTVSQSFFSLMSSQWCHPTVSSSIIPFSSCPQSLTDQSLFQWISSSCMWPKYWSFSFSISPASEYSGLISFRINWFISLMSKGLSRVFSNTTVQKHKFFDAQLSLWSNSHVHTWRLEKP